MFTVLSKNRHISTILIAALGFMLIITLAVISPVTAPTHTSVNDQQSLVENKGDVIKPLSADAFPQYRQSEWHSSAITSVSGMETYLNSERTSLPVRTASEPRLWSGEVFLSDNSNPDSELNLQSSAKQDLQNECISEDSLPRRYGGCVE